jgi:hypothetical protein
MGVPAHHASPPGNRLKAKSMADGQGEAGAGHRVDDCGIRIENLLQTS